MLPDGKRIARLRQFEELLLKWNTRINLVSQRDGQNIWTRHITDSLRLSPLIPHGSRVIDIGSGGGFPGIILGIACDLDITLIESDQRKCAFLREAARVCGLHAEIVCGRIENVTLPPAPFVTARALAPLDRLLGWTAPLLQYDGVALFLKGKNIDEELRNARRIWDMRVEIVDEPTRLEGVILKVSHIQRAGIKDG